MRKVVLCLFYALCAFAIAFQPVLDGPAPAGASLPCTGSGQRRRNAGALRAEPCGPDSARHRPAHPIPAPGRGRHGGRLHLRAGWLPTRLARQTDIYVNLLPENDALRVKQGMTVTGDAALQKVLEDLGG